MYERIRNCERQLWTVSAHSSQLDSRMQDVCMHVHILQVWRHIENLTAYVLEEQSCQIVIRNGLPDTDSDADRHQNVISWFLDHTPALYKISSKSVGNFFDNPVNPDFGISNGLPDPDSNADRHQNVISWSLGHTPALHKISSKSASFRSDLKWRSLRLFKERLPNKKNRRTRWAAIWNQFLIQSNFYFWPKSSAVTITTRASCHPRICTHASVVGKRYIQRRRTELRIKLILRRRSASPLCRPCCRPSDIPGWWRSTVPDLPVSAACLKPAAVSSINHRLYQADVMLYKTITLYWL